jgi:hypothetical protein
MSQRQTTALFLLIAAVTCLVACSEDPASPPDSLLCMDEASVDSLWTFETDSVFYACGQWAPAAPQQAMGLFDVFFRKPYGTHIFGPTEENCEAIRRAGGIVVHRYHLAAIRAIIMADSVRSLPFASHVTGVPNWEHFPVSATIYFKDELTQEDLDFLLSVGVTIHGTFSISAAAYGIVPDASIPIIRASPRVEYVQGSVYGCADPFSNHPANTPLEPTAQWQAVSPR